MDDNIEKPKYFFKLDMQSEQQVLDCGLNPEVKYLQSGTKDHFKLN